MPLSTQNPVAAEQAVFKALADPTRRAILSILADETLTLSAIVDRFDVSRPAIAKHISVLSEAGLVAVRPQGREKFHSLNPAALRLALDWIHAFDRFWDDRLAALKSAAEAAHHD